MNQCDRNKAVVLRELRDFFEPSENLHIPSRVAATAEITFRILINNNNDK